MPTEQRTSEWNKKVSGHIKYDFARITAAAINSNSHFVIISFPGFQKSKTFCIADLDWIQAADSGYQGDDYDSKDSEWFVFGETRKVLNGETTAVTTTTWDDCVELLRQQVDAHMNVLGTTYFTAKSVIV